MDLVVLHPEEDLKIDAFQELVKSKGLKIDVLKLYPNVPIIGQVDPFYPLVSSFHLFFSFICFILSCISFYLVLIIVFSMYSIMGTMWIRRRMWGTRQT